jgi:three-Cys-motif partner protein
MAGQALKVVFPRKKIATRVKHDIVQSYMKAWGGIIITSNSSREVRLSFVDTCSGSGLYQPSEDAESDVAYDTGSALIGLDVLDGLLTYADQRGADVNARALFINEDALELETLRGAIGHQDLSHQIPYTLLQNRLADVVSRVRGFCADRFSFILIDPYGPKAIPLSVVSELVSFNRTDCLINFPYYSVHKWVGWLDSGQEESRLQIVDRLLGGTEWRGIARQYRHDGELLEKAILDHYMMRLRNFGVGVIAIPMSFEDRDRTMYHLLFTSRNTAGLAGAKKELQKGAAYQAALKKQLKELKKKQLAFDFETAADDGETEDPVNVDTLAKDLRERFKGKSVTRDEVIRYGLQKPAVLESHVKRALTQLKHGNLAESTGTRYQDTIKFAS